MQEIATPSIQHAPPAILVVDDEFQIRELLSRWLTTRGFRGVSAESAATALRYLESEPVDLVTLDIAMPQVSGIELLRQIRQVYPDTAVLMLTGLQTTAKAIEALTAGAYGYLIKPVRAKEFLAQVEHGLEWHRFQVERRQYTELLEQRIREQTQTIQWAHEETIHRLVAAAASRDLETGEHLVRTGLYSEILARAAGWSPAETERIRLAAPMHDIGKIGLPDPILRRAIEAQERYSRYGEGGAARFGALDQFRRPLNEGGWIPWSVLAFGLALFGVMSGVVLIYLGRTVVEIDIQDPGVEVALKGTTLTVTGPDKQSVKVVPGDQELTITCAGLETITKSFSLKKGDKKTVTVSIVDSRLSALLENEIAPLTPGHEEQKTTSPIASGAKEKKEKEVVKTPSGAKGGAVEGPSPAAGSPEPNVATTASTRFILPSMVFGDWAIEGDELVQPNLAVWDGFKPGLIFGLNTLSNYDLTLEVKKTGGRNAMGIFFHWQSIGDYRRFELAGNREMNFSYRYKRKLGRDEGEWKALNYSSNQWYSLKVEARGATFRGYLDGVLQFERTDPRFTHGRIGLYTDGAAARFRRIKLCDPQGKVLLAGLPLLLPGRNKAAPKTDASESLPSLTAGETAAKSNQTQWAERLKTPVISTNSLGIKLALIPPGEFLMGSPKSEVGGVYGELQHPVRISKPFYVGVYEITQSEFAHVLGRNPSFFSNGGGASEKQTGPDTSQHPVEQVTWYDAVEFCNKLSQKERRPPYYRIAGIEREADGSIRNAQVSVAGGGGYRLPTEAQWEHACRAGTTTPFNFGTACNGVECNCNGNSPEGTNVQGPALRRTVPVGSYQPNAWGLCDMSGNVWEWCWDVFVWSYYEQSPKADPAGPPQGSLRLNRGGGWNGGAKPCRSASRIGYAPEFRSNGTGFRLARDSGE